MCLIISFSSLACLTPTPVHCGVPFRKIIKVGMLFIWYLEAIKGFRSTFTLMIRTFSLKSSLTSFKIDGTCLHGPHQSA